MAQRGAPNTKHPQNLKKYVPIHRRNPLDGLRMPQKLIRLLPFQHLAVTTPKEAQNRR